MKNKVYFAMGLHFHQPVGNFEKVLERAYSDCYRPFLEVLSKFPAIKITFHISGNLLDYFEKGHTEFLDKVKGLVSDGRAEIMGGGYYEPIFQAIPKRDRVGQIEMSSDYCEEKFGIRPEGIWTPERVWSPELIEDFLRCGMKYSILDDIHLIKAGVSPEELFGYFMTGEGSDKIAIFPSNKKLRYIIPFKAPRETMGYFKKVARKRKDPLFTYGDDAEKFGEWPWTHDWVYKKGWLNNFFKELEKNQDWITTITFSEYLDLNPALKEVQIPEASYEEMLEWSGGSWMNFLKRYPESEQMHKRMRYVSNKISETELRITNHESRITIEEARRELYKGQCNCAYWHGVFGGIYLHHLRSAVYQHLISADRNVDEIEHKGQDNWIDVKEADFYNSEKKTISLENRNFFISIDTAKGGIIRELDYKPAAANIVNTLARHREIYHKKILERINNKITEPLKIYETIKTMDERIRSGIFYDRYLRSCLVDHFIDKGLNMEDFANCNYIDRGDFADADYAARIEKKEVVLSREGKVDNKAVSVSKRIRISSDAEIEISYTLKNRNDSNLDALFGVEFNIGMPFADSERYRYRDDKNELGGLGNRGAASETGSFSIEDSQGELGIEFKFTGQPQEVWYFPVMAVSQSERAYDLSYQASCVFPIWNIGLAGGKQINLSIKWIIA